MELMSKLKLFYVQCARVLKITKKPTTFEFKTIVKVSALGIFIIGLLGFVVSLLKMLFFG